MHRLVDAMRDEYEDDPKRPAPVRARRKGDNALEAQESEPFEVGPHGDKDDHNDRHRHVRC